jgi:hypothetical protein
MADEEQLRILREGVKVWNRWRVDHRRIWPDLRGADLSRTDIGGVNLRGANLKEARLSGANLGGADLIVADLREAALREAKLSGANLQEAKLNGADLRRAVLSGADLRRADLKWADLSGADLGEADLREAWLGWTVFGAVNLSDAKGLDSVTHRGPSTIGIDTIYRSRGRIPEAFLRGAGVPDEFILYMGSLVGRPIEFYSCFISYSSKDQEFAERLHADLQAKGVRCWFAPEDMKIGDKIWDRLDRSIRLHDKSLLILSTRSIGSEWVEDEVTTAFEEERKRGKTVLFPVRLDDVVMATDEPWAAKVRQRHIGDFTRWKEHDAYRQAFERLLRDLKTETAHAPELGA